MRALTTALSATLALTACQCESLQTFPAEPSPSTGGGGAGASATTAVTTSTSATGGGGGAALDECNTRLLDRDTVPLRTWTSCGPGCEIAPGALFEGFVGFRSPSVASGYDSEGRLRMHLAWGKVGTMVRELFYPSDPARNVYVEQQAPCQGPVTRVPSPELFGTIRPGKLFFYRVGLDGGLERIAGEIIPDGSSYHPFLFDGRVGTLVSVASLYLSTSADTLDLEHIYGNGAVQLSPTLVGDKLLWTDWSGPEVTIRTLDANGQFGTVIENEPEIPLFMWGHGNEAMVMLAAGEPQSVVHGSFEYVRAGQIKNGQVQGGPTINLQKRAGEIGYGGRLAISGNCPNTTTEELCLYVMDMQQNTVTMRARHVDLPLNGRIMMFFGADETHIYFAMLKEPENSIPELLRLTWQ